MSTSNKYCPDIFNYRRRKTREVKVGHVGVGGDNPIRVQSMTIADTMDTAATVAEVIQLVEAGCEIVRITAPSINEAENLKNIKAELMRKGIDVPLVADIHFTPNAAMIAAEYVEKVRINPGNYADKKKFQQHEYSEDEYAAELVRIEEKFKPLVLKCKKLGRAMRIGTNHGSLSDRIMNRYGDTANGMVESALEFVRICEKYEYFDIILSMKSSNPLVAIQAYRLLAARMDELGMDYPFHLGVTEAGDGAEGRVKSAVGIGGLLEDGIGDTIRVSLTEDAVAEIPVAQRLVKKYNLVNGAKLFSKTNGLHLKEIVTPKPFEYNRRETLNSNHVYFKLGYGNEPRVELTLNIEPSDTINATNKIRELSGTKENGSLPILNNSNGQPQNKCEMVHFFIKNSEGLNQVKKLKAELSSQALSIPFALNLSALVDMLDDSIAVADRISLNLNKHTKHHSVSKFIDFANRFQKPVEWNIDCKSHDPFSTIDRAIELVLMAAEEHDYWNYIFSLSKHLDEYSRVRNYRYLAGRLDATGANFPILLRYESTDDYESVLLDASSQLGLLLCEGIGDSIHFDSNLPAKSLLNLGYDLLQATRLRISKTDYISCPSCGRTLFNLQSTTERIKAKTNHLKGVKIAIMGCIVNGPGEMADADFGYVGAGPKKINLYVGKECVERNIPEEEADQRLVDLIKRYGKWTDN